MADEIIKVVNKAMADMNSLGKLSRSTYFEVYEVAINGEQFCLTMSIRDAYAMRALLNKHGHKGVMHQHVQEDNRMRVCFNI